MVINNKNMKRNNVQANIQIRLCAGTGVPVCSPLRRNSNSPLSTLNSQLT
jgi:hypothetical protein